MKKHTLLAAVLGSALIISGCSNSGGSSNSLTGANFQNAAPGRVTIFRQDPSTRVTPPALFKPLTFTGIAVNGQVTFGPIQRPAEAVTTLNDVPVGTHHILVEDPTNPSLSGEVPVQVISGRTTHASDLVMQPSGPDRRNGILAKDNTAPVAVGDGFIQTERSTVGDPGANSVMAGYVGYAVTSDLPHPYRTNSWLTPLMAADNHHKIYLGSLPNPPAVDPNGDKALGAPAPNYLLNTQWQLPVYPHPWAIHYNQRQIESGPDAGQPNGRQGLLLDLETVRVTDGAQVPAPQGGDAYTGSKMAELNATLDNPSVQILMGFNANQAKVNRQGDYDAELVMRAVDDELFATRNLPEEAALKMIAVRGNPLLFFTAVQLPKIELALYAAGGLTHNSGSLTVSGREIGYDVITGPYPDGKTRTFALFYPGNSATYKSSPASIQELDFTNNQGTNYFALATLPAGAVDDGTLQKLAAAAFSFPTDSQVTYSWDQASNTVTETYRLITNNVLGLPEAAVSGLLPHHYQPSPVHNNDPILAAGPSAINSLRYDTPRGEMRIYDSGTFTCRYPYPGVLPFMPALDASDTAGKAQLDKWKDVFQLRHASHNPPYTDMNSGRGQSVYNLGKFLGRNMWAAASLRVNDAAYAGIAANVTTATREGLELFFRENPVITSQLNEGQAPYYTLYDSRVGTLNQYPNGLGPSTNFPSDSTEAPWDDFGALSRCNDHHFHYGYFIHAAAQVALQDPAWGARYKDAINQMVFDVANNSKINPSPILKFPKERFWDAYENRGMASGMTFGDVIGNNEESISEHINFWTGTILWAAATGQQAMLEDAICHHAAAVHTSWTYWFDPAGNYNSFMSKIRGAGFDPNWAGNGVARIFDAFSRWDTFFGIHPVNARGIVIIPVTPASFYHAMNPAYVTKMLTDYTNFVTKFDINPLKPNGVAPQKDENGRDVGFFTPDNQWERGLYWYAHFAKYWALANPDTGSNDVNADAIKRFWNVFPDYVRVQGTKDPTQFIIPQVDTVDVGDSGLLTYHMIRYMQKKGAVDTWVRATNTPFFASFFNATTGKRTYVGFNPTNAPLTITFDDGGSIPNVAPRSLGSFTQP